MKYESKLILTGNLFETEQIGEVDVKNQKYLETLKKVVAEEAGHGMKSGYIRFQKGIELAKKFQPCDPANPTKPFGKEIIIALQDLLKFESEEDMDRIKFYTASGTPLDKLHGVDAFLELEDKDKKVYRATFDLTVNPNKKAYKSDIVVLEQNLPDPTLKPKEYLEAIESYAKQVLSKMISREVQEKKVVLEKSSP